jgi:hypothetical protein
MCAWIKMCDNDHCTLSAMCVRYLAFPELEHQQYGNYKQKDDGTCDFFIELAKHPDSDN